MNERLASLAGLVPPTNGLGGQLSVEALLDTFSAVLEDVKPIANSIPHLSLFVNRCTLFLAVRVAVWLTYNSRCNLNQAQCRAAQGE